MTDTTPIVPTNFLDASHAIREHVGHNNPTTQPLVAAYTLDQMFLYVGVLKPGYTPGPLVDGKFPIPGRVFVIYDASFLNKDAPLGVKFTDEDPSDDAVKLHKFYTFADAEVAAADGILYLHDGTLPTGTES